MLKETMTFETHMPVQPAVRELAHSSISWRAIFAGLFISLLAYVTLTFLGVALGGANLRSLLERGGEGMAGGLGVGAGIWMLLSVLVSLFAGGYYAARGAGFIPIRIGRIQGLVVAALFFSVMFSQIGVTAGLLGPGVGPALKGASSAAVSMAGWTLFGTTLLGALFAMLGGGVGAGLGLSHPVSHSDEKRAAGGTRARGAA